MFNNQPPGVQDALALLFIAALTLSGCKGGGVSSNATTNVNVAHNTDAQTLNNPAWSTETANGTANETVNETRHTEAAGYRHAPPTRLQWLAPATRADGSKLYTGEIHGYKIYYKLRHQHVFRIIQVDDASSTHYPLKEFIPGVYEFSISTLDTEGLESQRSELVAVNII